MTNAVYIRVYITPALPYVIMESPCFGDSMYYHYMHLYCGKHGDHIATFGHAYKDTSIKVYESYLDRYTLAWVL